MDRDGGGFLPEALMIGIAEIDAQHEELFVRLQSLKLLCVERNCLPEQSGADLLCFLERHFATETAFARQAGIDFSRHALKHQANLAGMTKAVREACLGQRDIFSVLRYLEYWFERHIVEEDLPLGARLQAAGATRAAYG